MAGFVPAAKMFTWDGAALHTQLNWTVAGSSVLIACVGIALAFRLYYKENDLPARMKASAHGLWTAAYHRFYMDELYQFITHKLVFGLLSVPIAWFDRHIIDGTMNLMANVTNQCSFAIRRLQSGSIQAYVYIYLIGALTVAVATIVCVLI